jgi:general secretion pathway protein N
MRELLGFVRRGAREARPHVVMLGIAAGLGTFGSDGLAATGPIAAFPAGTEAGRPVAEPELSSPARPTVRTLAGNPLWAIPLRSLSVTRERPLFSPSRRPPPPPVVAAAYVPPVKPPPPKPPEPDQPSLTLVGTIVETNGGIGIFIDQATRNVMRLRIGQDHEGWVLRSVHSREVGFERERRKATLALPPPGAPPQAQAAIPAAPVAAQGGNTWIDGDGQAIAPPPGKRSPQPAPAAAVAPARPDNGGWAWTPGANN